jgi:hypothetical protein
MAYHLGRLLQEGFGYEAVAVGTRRDQASLFDYPLAMPSMTVEQMTARAGAEDILVCNAFFSDALYGLRLPCRKISYVQAVRTFQILDVFLDHYVFVSGAVRRFVQGFYGIDGPVIPAFIRGDLFRSCMPWHDRSTSVVLSARKHDSLVFGRFREIYRRLYPSDEVTFDIVPLAAQPELAAKMANSRYFLSLDVIEGFGLPMLEAMSCGCAVVGWDSVGCREYAEVEKNCLLSRYGDFGSLARSLHAVLHDDDLASRLSSAGQTTAIRFGKDGFERAWLQWFASILTGKSVP